MNLVWGGMRVYTQSKLKTEFKMIKFLQLCAFNQSCIDNNFTTFEYDQKMCRRTEITNTTGASFP